MSYPLVVDLASFQPQSEQFFDALKAGGVVGTVIKATEKTNYINPKLPNQAALSTSHGLGTNAYHFARFGGDQYAAVKEADYFIDTLERTPNINKSSYVALDYEAGASNNADNNTEAILTFFRVCINRGYTKVVFYTYISYINKVNIDKIRSFTSDKVKFWLANYDKLKGPGMDNVDVWQWADNGRFAGSSTDLNYDFFSYFANGGKGSSTPAPAPSPAPSPATPSTPAKTSKFKAGDLVTVTKPVDVNGTHLSVSGIYTIKEDTNGRAVITKNGQVVAAISDDNLTKSAEGIHTKSYTVVGGDTLSGIASKFGTSWQSIATINHIKNPNRIHVGQVLEIGSSASAPAATRTYVIKKGDTLSGIASKFGTSWQSVASANGLSNPNVIYAGQVLRIP